MVVTIPSGNLSIRQIVPYGKPITGPSPALATIGIQSSPAQPHGDPS